LHSSPATWDDVGANAAPPAVRIEGGAESGKMREIATFVRARSGDLTTSCVFSEETRGLEEIEESDHFDARTT
jgi:hypothetical protein